MKNRHRLSQQLDDSLQEAKNHWRWLIGAADPDDAATTQGVEAELKRSTHLFLMILIALCILFFLWACFGRLDVASAANGEVFPSSQMKTIQHLEGGIVQEILVKEGEKVHPGQALVTLESTASGADVQQLQVQIAALNIDIVRLKAELADFKPLTFQTALTEKHKKLTQEAKRLYTIRKQRYEAQINSQRGQVNQRKAEIAEISARLNNLKEALSLSDEQITISEELLKDDLTNRYNHIDLLREGNRLKSSIEEDSANLARAESALSEEKSDLAGLQHNYKEEVTQKLEESRRKLNELTQQMQKYADNLQRTTITAPVGGVVKQMYVFTKGGVVQPGATLLDIIPTGDQLIIDARLPVQDIGYIKIGQPAVIRLASADGMRFNKIDGHVTFISPDSLLPKTSSSNEKAEPYYKIRLVTDKNYFEGGSQRYQLYPGVQVTVNILTGSRTILSYILSPFISAFDNAMKER